MEVSFKEEIASLRPGEGQTFEGEGILAVTKAPLQSGVSDVGGDQGAPISHPMDVLLQSEDLLAELGVHLRTCTGEAAAAAMLGAPVAYPMRGAVTWKAIVGTDGAADARARRDAPAGAGADRRILRGKARRAGGGGRRAGSSRTGDRPGPARRRTGGADDARPAVGGWLSAQGAELGGGGPDRLATLITTTRTQLGPVIRRNARRAE